MEGLVVEPSRTYQKLLSSAIESGGLETQQVSSGSEALMLLRKQSFDLVFVAMHLQDMDASMFSSHLRADLRTRQIPVVMVTSNEDKKLLDEAFSAGVTEVFAKHELDKITSYAAQFSRKNGSKTMSGRILYIEDSPSAASMTSTILRDSGYTVDHFATGEEGIAAFQEYAYDLVLTDILLKGKLNGYGTVKALRHIEDESKKYVPLLVFSVLNEVAHKVELLRLGANDYVTKPLIQEELLARVGNLITSKKLLDKAITQQNLLQELATKDPLTGLYNRYFLMEAAPSKMREATRYNIPCSLIIVNVDQFKSINENYGHPKGDTLLREVASLLIKSIRQEDIAARFDGEEFALLLSHCTIPNAAIVAEKIRKSIENLHSSDLNVTASLGIAEICQDSTENFSEIFKAAREAIHQAQSNGGNQVITRL
ncbi:two-component system cell cycle response regulator [Nitrosomonas sp. Nm84]|uniref:diguanylate cyclase n=1 Tax=Nitrosomonas sp. Nm84 TaxID=200124 RepID=UPI000D761CC5|nr:diguanylate cyclase [Nitrosomonas sp. Nm84]PXW87268.1 two-component system cell cycle response regulator [Nitrosomonas sp. Nm84]